MDEDPALTTKVPDVNAPEYRQLSKYLDALGSEKRLQILRLIAQNPRDIRFLARATETTYENTSKHVDKLLSVGLIREGQAGENTRGQEIRQYVMVAGAYEAVLRNLGYFSHVQFSLSPRIDLLRHSMANEYYGTSPFLRVLGGPDEGVIIPLDLQRSSSTVKIGRIDPRHPERFDLTTDIVLSGSYTAVTRVSQPHARINKEFGRYYIEDCDSRGGTYLNGMKLKKFVRTELKDEDNIELARDLDGGRLVFKMPPVPKQDPTL